MRPVPDTLAGARVTVMGLGRFGGGLGVTKWLVGRGARVLLTDRADEAALAAPLAALREEV
ncbi:MAG: UDP-N-acetylmuramoyl-L-alanine--D-glutamate ligase, partial [Phycisphaerales bacterium]